MTIGNALNINYSINQLIYASGINALAGLTTENNGILATSATGVPSIANTIPLAVQANITETGALVSGSLAAGFTVVSPALGGTGVANASTLTLSGNLSTLGAFTAAFTMTGNTAVTFPTAGTLATTAATVSSITGTANQIAASAATGAVTLSIPNNPILPGTGGVTLPSGNTAARAGGAGTIRFNSQTNVCELTNDGASWATISSAASTVTSVSGTANRITSTGGTTPVIDISASYVGQGSITTLGTIGTGTWQGSIIALAYGGSNANLTASNGGIVWSNASQMQILSATATAGQLLLSGSNATPSWSTSTYPSTNAINTLLYASSANTMTALATGNNGVLITSALGVPSISSTLPSAVQGNITSVGALASGSLAAGFTAVTVPLGGTGNTTFTAYSIICAGTTATGTLQNVVGVGSTGQALVSNGPSALPTWQSVTGNVIINSFSQGRLTLTSGTPVTTSDVTAATTLYFTPYKGNYITLYTSGAWKLYSFSEISIAVPATTSTMYDVWAFDSGGNVTLEVLAWTNDTTRATALVFQDGVYCKSGALSRRYLGSFRTTTVSGQTEDSLLKRYVWNYNNRVERALTMTSATSSWTYATATWRQANASTANQIDTIVGVAEDRINVTLSCQVSNINGGTASGIGLGLSSTTINSATVFQGYNGTGNNIGAVKAIYSAIPTIGRTYYAWLEYVAAGTATYYSTAANINSAGITGSLLM